MHNSPLFAYASLAAQPLAPPTWSSFLDQDPTEHSADAQLHAVTSQTDEAAPHPRAPAPPHNPLKPQLSKTQLAEIESTKCRSRLALQKPGVLSSKGVSASKGVRKRRVSFESKATENRRKRQTKHRSRAIRARDDMLLHRRFLHAADERLLATAQSEGVSGLNFSNAHDKSTCNSCPFAMALKAKFANKKLTRATVPGGRVYTDLKTVKVRSSAGYKYIACLVDDFSRFARIFFLRTKDEFLEKALKPYLKYLSKHGIDMQILASASCTHRSPADPTLRLLAPHSLGIWFIQLRPMCRALKGFLNT